MPNLWETAGDLATALEVYLDGLEDGPLEGFSVWHPGFLPGQAFPVLEDADGNRYRIRLEEIAPAREGS